MSEQRDPPARPVAFHPAGIDELLDTGGGLLDELMDQAAVQADNTEIERWLDAQIGPYRITDYLDRGGMSLVFRAARCDGQFEQEVAVKVLRTTDAEELAKRFEQERQLLARLEHPGIAHIIDSGVVEGHPWIAMEFVDGEAIDAYCDRHQFGLDQRLGLFVQVASAVQFAHGRLVVHRDLKPSNILVNADGQTKLLDFGIAKALQGGTNPQLTGATMLLTPQYASPEQVLGEPVGVASDIYQLGLLLYRLLTGCTAQAMDNASVAEIMSVVVDDTPSSPSSRVETTGLHDRGRAEQIALARSTSLSRLHKTLDGDLDAIVNECLKKDPADRYVTVQNMIEDVTAYRDLRPIKARAPNIGYRAARFVQRHRGSVLSGALTFLVLIVAVVAVGLSWRSTIVAQNQALEEASAAKQVGEFLADTLEQANPQISGGDELTVRELLDQSAKRLDALDNRPRVHARLLEVMANAYGAMYLPGQAEVLAREALVVREQLGDPAALIEPLASLAVIRMQQGELEDALAFGRRAVETAISSGANPVARATAHYALATVLAVRGSYDAEREQLLAALAQVQGIATDQTRLMRASYLMKLGSNSKQQGDYEQARQEFESALGLLEDAPIERSTRMFTLRDLGTLHSNMGNEALAIDMLAQSLDLARDVYGNQNANILGNLVLLGRSLGNLNRNDDAEPLFLEALRIAEATIGKDHGNYARILHDYADVLRRRGAFARLREVRDEAVRIADVFFGPEHSTAVNLRKARAYIEFDEGRYPEAVDALDAVLPEVRDAFGESHMITFGTAAFRAQALLDAGNIEIARETMLGLVDDGAGIAGGNFYGYQRNLIQLSRLYRLTGPLDEALQYAEQAVALRRKIDGGNGWTMLEPLVARIQVLTLAGDDRADADIKQALSLIASNPDRMTLQMHIFLSDFAMSLAVSGYPNEAERFCKMSLAALEDVLAEDHPLLGYTMMHCADTALGRGAFTEAAHLMHSAVPAVIQVLGRTNWRSQWALALQAIADRQPEERAAALDQLREMLGDSSPLVRHLSASSQEH